MKFNKELETLLHTYPTERCGRKDSASLYGICTQAPPLAEHIIFDPMPSDVKKSLQLCYKKKFPQELLRLYDRMNGLSMFWTKIELPKCKVTVPISCFEIYGVPLSEDRRYLHPFDISVEDFDRPEYVPDTWLRFGSYYAESPETAILRDLCIDTDSGRVFAIEHDGEKLSVLEEWNSLDESLCAILHALVDTRKQN